ncbi:hypothetical protein [Polynucleobacter sphagniphilus]|uniref:hypothetical protein n=1 Tax=Polynucleobacter sphagniphilus TaxID=1743169 RepID=UPI002476DC5A|nr:hypothetical protein [Polynucleobacter sphagniphilus]MDH6299419.1 hypothetical protein [Polynucleobacter sphagniphilus]
MTEQTKQRIIELSEEQTAQLRSIWMSQKNAIKPDDWMYCKVKLTRSRAKFTINQLFRLTMTLAESGFESIPEWLLAYLDPT